MACAGGGAKPSTIRDYQALLREPETPYKRGAGESRGRIIEAFGDRPVDAAMMKEVRQFLRVSMQTVLPRAM